MDEVCIGKRLHESVCSETFAKVDEDNALVVRTADDAGNVHAHIKHHAGTLSVTSASRGA